MYGAKEFAFGGIYVPQQATRVKPIRIRLHQQTYYLVNPHISHTTAPQTSTFKYNVSTSVPHGKVRCIVSHTLFSVLGAVSPCLFLRHVSLVNLSVLPVAMPSIRAVSRPQKRSQSTVFRLGCTVYIIPCLASDWKPAPGVKKARKKCVPERQGIKGLVPPRLRGLLGRYNPDGVVRGRAQASLDVRRSSPIRGGRRGEWGADRGARSESQLVSNC